VDHHKVSKTAVAYTIIKTFIADVLQLFVFGIVKRKTFMK